ncbi:MAG TPA: hypothetical protein VKG38_02005 [Solirubrobacteraceae bacterium]|nr:hypothetical protein [Solirubrobacteraceae bacterium]
MGSLDAVPGAAFAARVAAGLLGVLAISAIAAGPASAAKLTLSEGGVALAPASEFLIGGRSNLEVDTSLGKLECASAHDETGLYLADVTNSKEKDVLNDYVFGGDVAPCQSFTGNAYVDIYSLSEHILSLQANGEAHTTGPVAIEIGFSALHGEQVFCHYSAKRLIGDNTATTSRQALEVGLGAKLTLSSASSRKVCPKTAEMSFSLYETEGPMGGTVEEQVSGI